MNARMTARALMLATGTTIVASAATAQFEDPWEVRYPHLEVGFDVGVMLWNGVDRDVVRPGGTVDARIG